MQLRDTAFREHGVADVRTVERQRRCLGMFERTVQERGEQRVELIRPLVEETRGIVGALPLQQLQLRFMQMFRGRKTRDVWRFGLGCGLCALCWFAHADSL